MTASPVLHHKALGIHPGAFVQATPPATGDVQDGVLWVDTSAGPPYALRLWRASLGLWQEIGTGIAAGSGVSAGGDLLTACLTFLSHGASICNDLVGKLHFETPGAQHTIDATGYQLPAGHRLEQVS